ncbi:hypothetical protein CC99x_005955 [Candidatus Berkiella cookevillensis]|uniref:Ppx/GppA phosphatase family protein n=1 Tax=Candidatus Berkiella cookevillensis TaxID=437022 RepID=A0A0Q9YTJ6_9GAMM|nr:hypothetical protein [Candidatus Berkiella cookevillensis]MCS5708448.1 hypothetical protein [Candidatus Berkiella cookevillensis]
MAFDSFDAGSPLEPSDYVNGFLDTFYSASCFDLIVDSETAQPSDNTSLPESTDHELNFKNIDLSQYSGRVAYDMGSGGTKIKGVLFNTEAMHIEAVFAEYSFPMTYSLDLEQSENNQFSDLIMEMGLEQLKNHKALIEADFEKLNLDLALEHYGVATAAFRKAENADLFLSKIESELDIHISVISQEEEGVLGYYAAKSAAAKENPHGDLIDWSDPIVWDIGGGSMQITHQEENGEFTILQSTIASSTFMTLFNQHIRALEDLSLTPNPINNMEFSVAFALAKEQLVFNERDSAIIKAHIEQGSDILAIGAVHNASVQNTINQVLNIHADTYSKEQISQAAELLYNLNDQQIAGLLQLKNPSFSKTAITNLILVSAFMEKFNVEQVSTVKANNTDGLIAQGNILSQNLAIH